MIALKNQYFGGQATVTCLVQSGLRKLHATYQDKSERVEEFDIKTHEILTRKYKKVSQIKDSQWVYEIGEQQKTESELTLALTCKNPIFVRKDTQQDFQFRIRNLNYPEDTYSVEIDDEKQQIVVKTTNKKYFKRIDIPDIRRANVLLQKECLNWVYKNSTLVISYAKPDCILNQERELRQQFEKLNKKKPQEGDIECVQQ